MASISTLSDTAGAVDGLAKRVSRSALAALDFFAFLPDVVRSAHVAARLSEMSDAQLAARGLTRDQIVEVAFDHKRGA